MRNSNTSPSSCSLQKVMSREEVAELTCTMIQEFLRLIVDHPEEVSVAIEYGERTTVFRVECTKRNFSKILGSKGRMISSVRNMALAITARHGYRSIVEIPYFAPEDHV
ncbi:KH domain-containing protein [Bdellovibrio sp. NC01]|uniref:KH domain-containing protein n=1 Tax=Bdellovibrio sp. NC01 TaxID=2220073 RepID=UPI001FEF69C6|nr:KH domain-containing protein [Bdellovibrio sp. NC01]